VGVTTNPPGSAGELNVAATPLFVSVKVVTVLRASVSKLNVAVAAAAGGVEAQ
jgi:hypothetical protein